VNWHSLGSAADSPFIRLDFRTKLTVMLTATVLAFLWESPFLMGGLVLLLMVLNLVARVRLSYILRVLGLMLPFYAILLITHGFFNTAVGRTALWTAPRSWPLIGGTLTLSAEGLAYGVMVALRTLVLILVTPLTIFTTDLNALVVGLVRLRVPYRIAFAFSATLRFVPLLLGEIQSISEAQRLRGLALERMSLWKRVSVYSRIAVPLILGALTRSQQIEVALAAKAFSGSPERTYLRQTALQWLDYALIASCMFAATLAIWLRVSIGLGKFALPGL
jgi:energy-coupling factor transport system permease protein